MTTARTDERPNILIVLADQLTAALTGPYGHPVVRTSALDRLGREGVTFEAAYSPCPLCAPARAGLLSGRYASRTRTYDNAAILPADVPCWPHHLRLAGYEVIASGKLHLIGPDQLHGFERRLTTDIYPSDFSWTPSAPGDPEARKPHGKAHAIERAGPCAWSAQLAYDEEVQFRALEFLRHHATGRGARSRPRDRKPRPFCLVVSYTHPHPPYLAPQAFWDLYEGATFDIPEAETEASHPATDMEAWLAEFQGVPYEVLADARAMRRLYRAYYGMVSYVDAKVGELLDELDRLGMAQRTAVLFASDHGDMLGRRRMIEKRLFYEWSARVPLLARYPHRWPGGARIPDPVSLLDVFPTLTELTGAPAPQYVDGRSLLPLLRGDSDADPERVALSEYHTEGGIRAPCFMVRKGAYKYVYIAGHGAHLFNLDNDPDEHTDLAGRPGIERVQSELHRALLARLDPEGIAEDVDRSLAERGLLRAAMRQGEPASWDYAPPFDAARVWTRD